MTYHAANFTAQWARETSEGAPPRRGMFPVHATAQAATFSVDGTGQLAPLTVPEQGGAIQVGPVHYEQIERVELVIENDNGTSYHCTATRESTNWTIVSSVAGDVGVFANNGELAIEQPTNPWRAPNGAIKFDGAALAAFDDGAAFVPEDIVEGTIFLSNGRSGMGFGRFSEFVNIPPDDSSSQANALDRLNRQFATSAGQVALGVRSDGVTAYALNCDLALMPGSRRIFLRASDFGNQNEQIPAAVENNTPGHFRFFPGAFFRRHSYVRTIAQAYPDEPDGTSIIEQAADFQPYQLSVVARAPTLSAWRIVVDGTIHEVWIDHPAGSDYRTAVEIWNGVWGPILQQSEAQLNALTVPALWDRESVPQDGGDAAEAMIHRMKYVQYAELLAVSDRDEDITTDDQQDNTSQVQ